LRPQLIAALLRLAIVFFKGCNDGVEFLDILAGSGFEYWGYIDLISKLKGARAKFSEVAYRFRPSFFAPGDLLIKATHGQFHLCYQSETRLPTRRRTASTRAIIPELQL
jgi:hypothetical protein